MTDSSPLVPLRYYFLCLLGVAGLAPSVILVIVGDAPGLAGGIAVPFALLVAWSGYRLSRG